MEHRAHLTLINPIILMDETGYIYRLSDVLEEVRGDWGQARRNPEVARLDDLDPAIVAENSSLPDVGAVIVVFKPSNPVCFDSERLLSYIHTPEKITIEMKGPAA